MNIGPFQISFFHEKRHPDFYLFKLMTSLKKIYNEKIIQNIVLRLANEILNRSSHFLIYLRKTPKNRTHVEENATTHLQNFINNFDATLYLRQKSLKI